MNLVEGDVAIGVSVGASVGIELERSVVVEAPLGRACVPDMDLDFSGDSPLEWLGAALPFAPLR